LLFVLFYVLFVCKCVLPPGDNLTAVNKYIISYTVRGKQVLFMSVLTCLTKLTVVRELTAN